MRNWILVLGSLLVLVGCGGEGGDSGGTAGADGAAVYRSNCAICHGANGQGGTGPPLVGNVPGFSESDLTNIVTNGIRTMPAFGSSLSEEEIDAVVQFLLNELG